MTLCDTDVFLPATRPMPSMSPLTGTMRSATTAAIIEKSFQDLKKANNRSLTAPPARLVKTPEHHELSKHQADEMQALKQLASRHVSAIEGRPFTPSSSIVSASPPLPHDERLQLQRDVVSKLKKLASSLRTDRDQSSAPSMAELSARYQSTPNRAALGANPLPSRPSTSMSARDITPFDSGIAKLERLRTAGSSSSSTSKYRQVRRLPCQQQLAASWSGPSGQRPGTPGGGPIWDSFTAPQRLGTAARRLQSREGREDGLGRRSCPATPLGRDYDRDKSSRPQLNTDLGFTPQSTMSGGTPRVGTVASVGACSGVIDFNPTRGQVYVTFSELDRFNIGKVTWSQFEEAAYKLGLSAAQTKKMFDGLDREGRGYLTIKDWGSKDHSSQIENFTRLYWKRFRNLGPDGKPLGVQEVTSLDMAVQLAMWKMAMSGKRTISNEKVSEAFHFIDTDGSGLLDSNEMFDAFNALGIYINDNVIGQIMQVFDKDNNGSIDYGEFVRTLFPTLSKNFNYN